MIGLNITVPQRDIDAMSAAFAQYVQWFRKGPQEAVKKTCVYILRSLSASTKVGAKNRRIVKNPSYAKTGSKRERQLMHIAEWNRQHGKPAYMPQAFQRFAIQRFGQRGGPYFKPVNGATNSEARTAAQALDVIKGDKSNVYRIARRGLAKSSWGWMLGKLGKPSLVTQAQISNTTDVREGMQGGAFEYSYIEMTNKLAYIQKAMKSGGKQAVSSVLARASKAMIDEMEGHVKKAREQSGLRAA